MRISVVGLLLLLPGLAWGQTVVLDPGHGGTNLGARSHDGKTYEKRITLILAKLTAAELIKLDPKLKVVLTRTHDRYLTLEQRGKLANRVKADAFVSIHLNASESRAQRGFETYVLTRDSADRERERIAAHNKAKEVSQILAGLRQRGAIARSAQLAAELQRGMRQVRGKRHDRGVRQAPFDVLLGLKMPGALVEVGFIDHLLEGPQLLEPKLQRRLAKALALGTLRALRRRGWR